VHIKGEGGTPEDLLFRDKPLLLDIAMWVLAVVLVLYAFR